MKVYHAIQSKTKTQTLLHALPEQPEEVGLKWWEFIAEAIEEKAERLALECRKDYAIALDIHDSLRLAIKRAKARAAGEMPELFDLKD